MPATRRWTVDDVRALAEATPDGTRYELIDGTLIVTPAPRWRHQFVVGELLRLLCEHLAGRSLAQVLMAPADLELKAESITQPDLFVVPVEEVALRTGNRLLLVIEVISPASARTDRTLKREFYLARGAAEYWVVDGAARAIECWRPGMREPVVHRDTCAWHVGDAPSLVIDVGALFARVDTSEQSSAWLEGR